MPKRKLVIELIGGTGNQLFQLIACATLAKSNNRIAYFNQRLLDGNRNFETKKVANILGIKEIQSNEILDWLILKEEQLSHPFYYSLFPENNFLPDKDLILSGYFQNYRIHDKSLIEQIKKQARISYQKIYSPRKNFIAIHMRELQISNNERPNKYIDHLNIDYYKRSLGIVNSLIARKNETIKDVYLFTDMFKNTEFSRLLPEVKKLLKKNKYNIIFGDNICSTAWESISIMSQAKYIIIANSTFSWWAGYLSNSQVLSPILSLWETRLLTPDSWLQINDGNLYPKTWHNTNIYMKEKIVFQKRFNNSLLARKIKHIFNFYIANRIFNKKYRKLYYLKIRNLLS